MKPSWQIICRKSEWNVVIRSNFSDIEPSNRYRHQVLQQKGRFLLEHPESENETGHNKAENKSLWHYEHVYENSIPDSAM